MSKQITIRNDLYEMLNGLRLNGKLSFSGAIDLFIESNKRLLNENNILTEATVTQEGRITKTLAGKTILYKVKE